MSRNNCLDQPLGLGFSSRRVQRTCDSRAAEAACDVHAHIQHLNASHISMRGGRFHLWRDIVGARGARQRFSSDSEPEPLEGAGCGSHREHDQPRVTPQRHARPPEGAPVQGVGDRRPGRRENLHHPALRAPDLLHQLPGHHRGGLRLEGAELGFGDGPASALGHRRYD